jgi:hypothetical protein
MVLDFLRKKKEVHLPTEAIPDEALPEELERFRIRKEEPEPATEPVREYPAFPEYGENVAVETTQPTLPEPAPVEERTDDRIELILQKLETIDTRLKLIEERLRR